MKYRLHYTMITTVCDTTYLGCLQNEHEFDASSDLEAEQQAWQFIAGFDLSDYLKKVKIDKVVKILRPAMSKEVEIITIS